MQLLPILIALAALSAACSGPYSEMAVSAGEPTSAPQAEVRIERVEMATIPEIVAANGELYAEEEATLGPKVPGRVAKLHVDLGDVVKAGQVLAELERSDYEFRLRQSEALVDQTRAKLGILDQHDDAVVPEETAIVRHSAAELKEARFIFQTTETLANEGVLSKIDMEKAGVARDAAEAAYQGALEQVMQLRAELSERRAQLELIRQNLADCEVRAPFDGAVTERVASLGEYLPVNGPVVRVVRQDPLRLRLEVPERGAARVRIGQRIDLRVEGMRETPSGKVIRMSPAIDAESRSLLVEGAVPNPSGLLRPGAFAEGRITVNADAQGIAVARDSVLSFAGVERVFVVADGKLEDRVIRTGRLLTDDRVEVIEGLESGASVVRQVSDRLTPGQPARVL